jgi:protease secretion system membrane fusion protein
MEMKAIRYSRRLILIVVIGFLAWGLFIPLDSGTPSTGIVSVDGHRKPIQHSSGGTVAEVYVKEGQKVSTGDALLKLEDSATSATLSQIRSEIKATSIEIQMLQRVLPGIRELVQDGFYAKNQYLDKERKLNELLAQQVGLKDRLIAAQKELERTFIRSPVDGNVMGLTINYPGAVVVAGVKLMEIAPAEEELIIDAQIKPHLINRIHPGNAAQVRFSALQSGRTPVVMGELEWVSADRFQNREDNQNPDGYYLARVNVSKGELSKLDNFKIISGMPADVIIKTGERTFFQYVFKPITDRLAHTIKEY